MAKATTGKAGMPYADMPLAKFISKQIDIQASMGKNQREIAAEVGYEKPNMISMFKRGETKIPLEKIPVLAKALNVDPAYLFKLAIQQYWPNIGSAIAEIFGTVLTRSETKLIELVRQVAEGAEVEMTREFEREIKAAVKNAIKR